MARQPGVWYRDVERSYYSTIDGKQHRLLKGVDENATNESKAEGELKKLLRTLRDGPIGPDPSFAVVADEFLDHSQTENDLETYEVHRLFLQSFRDHVGSRKVSKLCEADIDDWFKRQAQEAVKPRDKQKGRGGIRFYRPWSDNTKVRARAIVLAALNFGVRKRNLPPHPLRHVRAGTVDRREKILTPEERKRIHAAVSGVFADYLTALELTGARPFSEVAKITADDVDLEQGTWTLTKWKNSKKQKGKKRVIYLVPEMLELTRKLVGLHPEGPLFRNQNGEPWTRQTLTARFRRLAERTGIEDLTAYVVRHCFITDALTRGIPVAMVAELCGTSIQTIERHYRHLDQRHDALREAMKKAVGA